MRLPSPWIALMHELSICESVLKQMVAIAGSGNASGVLSITLRVGPLSGVEPELLRAAFPLVAHGTPCEATRIEIETIPVLVQCKNCLAMSEVPPNRLVCASCGTWRVAVRSGDEMLLARVELHGGSKSDDEAAYLMSQKAGEQISV